MRLTTAALALTLLPALAGAGPVRAGEMPSAAENQGAQDPAAKGASAGRAEAGASRKVASRAAPAPTRTASALGRGSQVPDASQAPAAPFNPRWVAPGVQIKGLTVFIFTPGHFQRD